MNVYRVTFSCTEWPPVYIPAMSFDEAIASVPEADEKRADISVIEHRGQYLPPLNLCEPNQ